MQVTGSRGPDSSPKYELMFCGEPLPFSTASP